MSSQDNALKQIVMGVVIAVISGVILYQLSKLTSDIPPTATRTPSPNVPTYIPGDTTATIIPAPTLFISELTTTPLPGIRTSSCSFFESLVTRGVVLQELDIPSGSNRIAGVQIRIHTPVQVPREWIVQRGNGDEYGPIDLKLAEVASVWSPEYCRPLPWPIDSKLDCSFLETSATKIQIVERIDQMGAQVRVMQPLLIPNGWVIQRGNGDEYGPMNVNTIGEVISIYAPESCRPINIP